jgi:hypothetical protein
MGPFSNPFRASSTIEEQLEEQYVPIFQVAMGMSSTEAKNTFRDMLKQAKEDSQNEGTSNLPQNFGDHLLERESTTEKTKSILDRKRAEGVRDKDIRWWWNMHDIERRMMLKIDDLHRLALFMKLREEGLDEEQAAERVGKSFPIFGDPDDTTHTIGEDRPLPYELKDRINIYIEKRSRVDPEQFKKEIDASSSVNSLIRKELSKGSI